MAPRAVENMFVADFDGKGQMLTWLPSQAGLYTNSYNSPKTERRKKVRIITPDSRAQSLKVPQRRRVKHKRTDLSSALSFAFATTYTQAL